MNRRSATGLWALAGVMSVALGWWAAGRLTAPAAMPARPNPEGLAKPARPGAVASGGLVAGFAAVCAAGDVSAQMAAAVAMAGSIDPGDFARFLEMLDRLPAHAAQGLAARTLLRRWTALDPQAALQWCLDHNGEFVDGVAGEWARLQPAMAGDILALISNSPIESARSKGSGVIRAATEIFKALASQDREAAMELLLHPKFGEAIGRIDDSLRLLARQDPAWMLARAESLPDSIRPAVRKAAAQAMAETSMHDAFEWVRGQPDRMSLVSSMMHLLKNLPDLLAELASWSPEEQIGVRVRPPNLWVDGDQALLVDAIEAHGSRLSDPVIMDLLRSAPANLPRASDPGALANRLLALPAAADHFRAGDVAAHWAKKSPEAALAWASSLADATQRQEAMAAVKGVPTATPSVPARSLADELAHQAGQGAMSDGQQLVALTESERRRVFDAGLLPFLKNQESDPFSDPFSSSFDSVGTRYPAEVAEWMTHTLNAEDTPRLIPALTAVASAWAGESPAAAAAWAAGLPPGEARAWAAANVVGQWRLFDEAAARAWINTLPPDERAIAVKAVPELQVSP